MTIAALTGIYLLRRPTQVSHPYVWVEESTVLQNFLNHGWLAAFIPVHGYLVLPASPLIVLSAAISWVDLPRLDWTFDVLLFVATVAMLLLPASRWGPFWIRAAMATSLVLVPAGPEIFGVLLLSFWWASLWPLIVLGWKSNLWPLRGPILAIAALSSPAGGAFALLFVLVYVLERRRRDLVSAAILGVGFVVEVVLVQVTGREVGSFSKLLATPILNPAHYEAPWLAGSPVIAIAALLALLLVAGSVATWRLGRHESTLLLMSAALYSAAAGAAVPGRLNLAARHVILAGRYMFLPFVALAWLLISFAQSAPRFQRLRVPILAGACVLLAVPMINLPVNFAPQYPSAARHLNWARELTLCAQRKLPGNWVPVYSDGYLPRRWHVAFSPTQCATYVGIRSDSDLDST